MTQADPRLTMARLPEFIQVPLTLAIGKPLPGQVLPTTSPVRRVCAYGATHVIGVVTTFFCVHAGGRWLAALPLTLYLLIVGARHLQVGGIHHMVHCTVARTPRWNHTVGRLLSTWLLIEEYDSYKSGHLKHHAAALSTEDDPTVQALEAAGLRFGMPVTALKRRLLFALLSPLYHAATFARRIASYGRASERRKIALLGAHCGLLLALTFLWPLELLITWWIPMTVGYQSVSLIRAVVEHWPETHSERDRTYVERTTAIFCGAPLPSPSGSFVHDTMAILRWCATMSVEMACRGLFVSSDGPNHDLHHLNPSSAWPNHAALRLEMEARLQEQGRPPLSETWGFWRTLNMHILEMSNARPGVTA